MRVIWSSPAEADLDDLVRHIAAENLAAALAQEERIHEAVARLGEYPRMGRVGRRPMSRELVVSGTPYVVVYYVSDTQVEVARVMHGARAWPRPDTK